MSSPNPVSSTMPNEQLVYKETVIDQSIPVQVDDLATTNDDKEQFSPSISEESQEPTKNYFFSGGPSCITAEAKGAHTLSAVRLQTKWCH